MWVHLSIRVTPLSGFSGTGMTQITHISNVRQHENGYCERESFR